LLEQAISGYVTQAITDGADTTITIPNGTTGVARNMAIEMTGALSATRNLIVPANKKLYFIFNNTSGGFAVTVKVTGLTGVSVPNGKKVILVSNGTDIVEAVNQVVGNLAVGGTLAVTGAGTFSTTLGVGGKTHIGSGSSGDSGGYLQIEQDTPTALMNIDFQMYNYSGATKMGGMRFYVQDSLRAQIDSYTDDFTAKGDLRFYTSTGGTMTQNMLLGTSGDLTVTGQVSASAIAGTAVATQANQETATSTTTAVSPGRQQFHPSAAKAWVRYQTVTTTTNIASYNVASLTDNGTGDTTITYTTNFSSGTSYNGVFMGRQDSQNVNVVIVPAANYTASTVRVLTYNDDVPKALRDYEIVCGTMFGDQ